MTRFLSAAFAMFVGGGLLTGILGLRNLATVVDSRALPAIDKTSVETPPAIRTAPPTVGPAAAAQTAPTSSSNTDTGVAWWFLYAADGDLWERFGDTSIQLTRVGQLSQPTLGDAGLAFVQRSRNASDVWLATPDGPPRPLTRNSSSTISQNRWASQPVFVPGRQRLYVLGDFNKSATGQGDLAIWEATIPDGSVVQITRPPAYAGGDQDVTPDPRNPQQIVFTRYSYAGTQLLEQLQWLDVSTDIVVPLTPAEQPSRQASYAPDGSEVAFIQQGAGSHQDLYVAHLQVSGAQAELDDIRQVATGVCANPVWSPDGKELGYMALINDQFQIWSVSIQRGADGAESFGPPRQVVGGSRMDATSRPVYLTPKQADDVQHWLEQMGS